MDRRPGWRAEIAPAAILALTVCAANLALVLGFTANFVSNDAAQYLSEARSIRAGRGLTTDIAYYDEHHRLGRFPVPQTVFPPGYPLAIAAVAATGLREPVAAFVVCLLAFNLSVALAWTCVRRASASPPLAALAGIVLAGSVRAGIEALQCDSEMLFLAATLAGLLCVQCLGLGGPWPSLLAGFAAAAAVSVRYAGIFFVAALAIVMLVRLARLRTRRALGELALALGPGVVTTLILLARNYLLVGDAKGGNALELSRPATEVLAVFAWSVQGLLGYSRTGLAAGRPQELLLLGVVAVLVVLAIAARPEWRGGLARRLAQDAGTMHALGYISISLVALWHLERTRYLGVSSRMLLPLVPFAVVVVGAVAPAVRWRSARLPAVAVVALLVVVYLVGQLSLLPPQDLISRQARVRSLRLGLARPDTARLLSQDAELRRPFLTNEPQALGALLPQPVVGLTAAMYTGTRWSCDATERLARSYGVRHVVFFRQAFLDRQAEAPRETGNEECFRSLARGEVPSWLAIVQTGPDPQLFEVRE